MYIFMFKSIQYKGDMKNSKLKLNIEEHVTEYEVIYSNNINKVKQVFERYVKNDNKRAELFNKMKNYQNTKIEKEN